MLLVSSMRAHLTRPTVFLVLSVNNPSSRFLIMVIVLLLSVHFYISTFVDLFLPLPRKNTILLSVFLTTIPTLVMLVSSRREATLFSFTHVLRHRSNLLLALVLLLRVWMALLSFLKDNWGLTYGIVALLFR